MCHVKKVLTAYAGKSNTYEANTQHKNNLPVVGSSVSEVSFEC